ncbi:hypothetical protein [Kaistia sp. MMO-174]|uniref:hypothetical protein n=1 Tax=Kaistia sp. MMO-174 TaxID=3081256 RepID=UPI00301A3455
MSDAVKIEILAEILLPDGATTRRMLGREPASGAWCLCEEAAGGDRRILSEMVTPELAENYALAILAGDDRTITKSPARLAMAILIVGVCYLRRQADKAAPPEFPPGGAETSGDGRGVSAPGAAPAAEPPPVAGDLFSSNGSGS